MTKATFVIRTNMGFQSVNGYITEDGKHGIDKRNNAWHLTDIATGIALSGESYKTRNSAIEDIARAESVITQRACRESERYSKAVAELNKFKGVDKESEVKTMKKTNKAQTEVKAEAKAKRHSYKAECEALKAEIEALKKALAKGEATTIDTFDVEAYLSTRDNSSRITKELIEALDNTSDLDLVFKGKDGWLYVSGNTKERKDIFKAMGFRWSGKENSWFIAPYPLANGKRWASKKAKAMATA